MTTILAIVHESSHFIRNGGTQDYRYGKDGCKHLANNHPAHAVMNADCHEYFAENHPKLH
jgi:peptidyl-Lys metalloendopeptidase